MKLRESGRTQSTPIRSQTKNHNRLSCGWRSRIECTPCHSPLRHVPDHRTTCICDQASEATWRTMATHERGSATEEPGTRIASQLQVLEMLRGSRGNAPSSSLAAVRAWEEEATCWAGKVTVYGKFVSAAATHTFSALPTLPTLPSLPNFLTSTPSSTPKTNNPPGIRLTDNSTRMVQVPMVLGVVVSGTGVSFEVSTSYATFLIDTLSDELFGQEKPMLTFEVQKVSGSWNSAQNQWINTKRTWEVEMAGFFFNVSWESDQLAALADMWDKADEQAARDSLEEDSATTPAAMLLKVRRWLRRAEPGKTRLRSVKVHQSVGRLRRAVERQVDIITLILRDLQEIHGHMSEGRSVSCGAGNFLQSRQQTGETTGVSAVSDGVSLSHASDSMYAFCKIIETCLIEIDALMSKASEDVDLLQQVGWRLSKGLGSLVISMAAKEDGLVKDGDEHAKSERLVRNDVVKIVRDVKGQMAGHFAAQYNL
ncbi:hypothetical protein CGGC5_v017344 [Colletotrichum fructicola Nara gc5]|uniref:Uncharacterized protein n=1 Tax=Colletotrichum fructicola (strain Nara gc5) TaxID=1213859 RepID=A0A7J6IC57_COLFN|nr:hypothetical protein CGGC5_v017344 [Colletotrichum fructicola Nara gc5]